MAQWSLHALLEGVDCRAELPDLPVGNVRCDSRQVEPGDLFVCIPGGKADGHRFARQALAAGAAAVVCQRELGLERQILTPDSRLAYAQICANQFGNPQRRIKMVGVTGTNGKTTVTHLIKGILEGCGHKAGLIGTVENQIGAIRLPAKYTTPDPATLFALLDRMARGGCEYAVMEVSSHGLDQNRVAGCRFAMGVFTNLTQDHLDYHGTMENYYQAKKKLFAACDQAVINLDDPYGRRLLGECGCPARSFSTRQDAADFTAKCPQSTAQGSSFAFVGNGVIARAQIGTPGDFSIANAMAALAACVCLGIPAQQAADALARCAGVPGRLEVLPSSLPFVVIRDYAHTPDGLEKALSAVRPYVQGRLMTLFGCAGERDGTKRPAMAEIVARYSDLVVLTSDNPRGEDPQQIIDQALPGLLEHPEVAYRTFVDRYAAIEWALRQGREGDVLLLCGKGHEDYQVLGFGTVYFDEQEIVAELSARICQENALNGKDAVL